MGERVSQKEGGGKWDGKGWWLEGKECFSESIIEKTSIEIVFRQVCRRRVS